MASGSMLTLLSVWWPLGQLLASLSKSTIRDEGFSKRLTLSKLPGVSFQNIHAATNPRVISRLLVLPVATKPRTWAGGISASR